MMKNLLVATAAIATLGLGQIVPAAHAAGSPSVTAAGGDSIAADPADLSAARKKKKGMRPAGASKAGTGGGAGGESGSGSAARGAQGRSPSR
jgi:hypothetical protein